MRFIGDPEPNSPILRQTLRRIINEIWKWKGLNVVSYIYFDNRAICKQQIKKKECIGYRYEICGDHSLKELKKKKEKWQKICFDLKGWSCCKRRVTDFTEFLNIKVS